MNYQNIKPSYQQQQNSKRRMQANGCTSRYRHPYQTRKLSYNEFDTAPKTYKPNKTNNHSKYYYQQKGVLLNDYLPKETQWKKICVVWQGEVILEQQFGIDSQEASPQELNKKFMTAGDEITPELTKISIPSFC